MRTFLSVLNHNNFVGRKGRVTKISSTDRRFQERCGVSGFFNTVDGLPIKMLHLGGYNFVRSKDDLR